MFVCVRACLSFMRTQCAVVDDVVLCGAALCTSRDDCQVNPFSETVPLCMDQMCAYLSCLVSLDKSYWLVERLPKEIVLISFYVECAHVSDENGTRLSWSCRMWSACVCDVSAHTVAFIACKHVLSID